MEFLLRLVNNLTSGNEWTSGSADIDEFIKDARYNTKNGEKRLQWIPMERLIDLNQLHEDEFVTIYSAIWLKEESHLVKVTLKKFNGSQNLSTECLNEVLKNL